MTHSKIDILLVDDKEENLLALEAVLQSPLYNLIKKKSGAEALKHLLHHDCAIILLDVQMPEMDGFETASFIKKSERSRNIPIIFITAINTDDRFVQVGYKSGAVDYLFKPFEPEILKSKVAVFAELYRNQQEIRRQNLLLRENDRKDRERALAELELRSLRREQVIQSKYRELVESLEHAIIWSLDFSTSTFAFVSPSAQIILGHSLENGLETSDAEAFAEAVGKLPAQEHIEIEHRFRRADGKELWFHTGMRLAKKNDGQRENEIRGLSIDITQIKETQEALRRSEERSRLLADSSFLLAQSLDYSKTVSEVAQIVIPSLADWCEIALRESDGTLTSLAFNSLDPQRPTLSALMANDAGIGTFINEILERGESEFSPSNTMGFRALMILPLMMRGQVGGFLALALTAAHRNYALADFNTAEDLARRLAAAIDNSRLYRDTQSAVRARDEFLSIASHELKTPLTPLKLHTQLLLRTLAKNGTLDQFPLEKIIRMAESSDRQIQRLAQLVDDLLDISRMNIGKLEMVAEEFDLADLINDVLERFAGQVQQSSCTIQLDMPHAVIGRWDRFRLEQVFINLLTNALKYGAGKPVTISMTSPTPNFVHLEVKDQGIGIAKEDQNRIFERFERAVSSTHFGGLGLGLYIANEIARAHGGQLLVHSELGKGSSFTLALPTVSLFAHPPEIRA